MNAYVFVSYPRPAPADPDRATRRRCPTCSDGDCEVFWYGSPWCFTCGQLVGVPC